MPIIALSNNNESFPAQAQVVAIDAAGAVELVFNNYDDGEHPMHMHGAQVAVLGVGADERYDARNVSDAQRARLNLVNPPRRDVFTIPASGWAVVRLQADNPGPWALHCHIEWHTAAGMVMVLNVLPQATRALPVPAALAELCRAPPTVQPNVTGPAGQGSGAPVQVEAVVAIMGGATVLAVLGAAVWKRCRHGPSNDGGTAGGNDSVRHKQVSSSSEVQQLTAMVGSDDGL